MKNINEVLKGVSVEEIREGYKQTQKSKGQDWRKRLPASVNGVILQPMFIEPVRETEFVLIEDVLQVPVYGPNGEEFYIERYVEPSAMTPEMVDWENDAAVVEDFIHHCAAKIPLCLVGDPGTGKSVGLEVIHASLNMDCEIIQITGETDSYHMLGEKGLIQGEGGSTISTKEYGPIPNAFMANANIIMNELDYADHEKTSDAMDFLRSRRVKIKQFGNENIQRGADSAFLGTMNTRGNGNLSGDFDGANAMNKALQNRWSLREVLYPSFAKEVNILTKAAPGVPEPIIQGLVKFAGLMRSAYRNGDIPVAFGVRSTVDAVSLLERHRSPEKALLSVLLSKIERDEEAHRQAIFDAIEQCFDNKTAERLSDLAA